MPELILDFNNTNKISIIAHLCIHKQDQQRLKQLGKLQDHEMSSGFKASNPMRPSILLKMEIIKKQLAIPSFACM